MSLSIPQYKVPTIYVFTLPFYKNAKWEEGTREGKGILKIGYTEQEDEQDRIRQQFPTLMPDNPETLLVRTAIDDFGNYFKDHDVLKILENKGVHRIRNKKTGQKTEYVEAKLEEVIDVLDEIITKKTKRGLEKKIDLRDEQKKAIKITSSHFKKFSKKQFKKAPHFLWNAKMRFGKTVSTYYLAKEMDWKKILVLTWKPAVQHSWRDDLVENPDFKEWSFVDRKSNLQNFNKDSKSVFFYSFQYVLGKEKNGKIKKEIKDLYNIEWDCIVIDEYHYGAWREASKDFVESDSKPSLEAEEFKEDSCPLKVKNYLYLSGTPFRALAEGEFTEDEIFNWTYADEQKMKTEFNKNSDQPNPYNELPRMNMCIIKIPDEIRRIALTGEYNEFDLNEFFRSKKDKNKKLEEISFDHEEFVQKWIYHIRDQYNETENNFNPHKKIARFPFADKSFISYLKHTIWFLPDVSSCYAMKNLLQQEQNDFFNKNYKIILMAGNNAGVGVKAFQNHKEQMGNQHKTKTITLTCGKLMTGVTVPAWSGIFMLSNTQSPEKYFQAAFRVQNPNKVMEKDPYSNDGKTSKILKKECYIFDFHPNRALKLVVEISSKLNTNYGEKIEYKVKDFTKFMPVLAFNGNNMVELNPSEILDYHATGTSPSMLALRFQSDALICVDNFTLEKLVNNKEVINALENLEDFRGLSKDIHKVLSVEKSINKTLREKKVLTEGQKKQKKEQDGFKKQLKKKLKKFNTRIPIFMYLTDLREENLKDVITKQEPKVFERVTGLTVKIFEKMCELGVFHNVNMDHSIFSFRKFEDSSLNYVGGTKRTEIYGGFEDSKISREELKDF